MKVYHLAVIAATLTASAYAEATTYTPVLLNSPVISKYTGAIGINNSGQIIGWGNILSDGDTFSFPLIWNAALTPTARPEAPACFPVSINNSGKIIINYGAGSSILYNGIETRPTSGYGLHLFSINNHNQAAGSDQILEGFTPVSRAIRWDDNNNTATVLGSLGGKNDAANAINDSGVTVGASTTTVGSFTTYAVRWDGTAIHQLSDLPSKAIDINNSGQIVGSARFGTNSTAALWSGDQVTNLGSLGDFSEARAINASGAVVGFSHLPGAGFYDTRATLWLNGEIIDLNAYLSADLKNAGWVFRGAYDINDQGDIVGELANSGLGVTRAFLLSVSAVPEPTSYAMFGAGMALLAVVARRRKGALLAVGDRA